jgi:hypothetical protein
MARVVTGAHASGNAAVRKSAGTGGAAIGSKIKQYDDPKQKAQATKQSVAFSNPPSSSSYKQQYPLRCFENKKLLLCC